jgi:hypothetical protein
MLAGQDAYRDELYESALRKNRSPLRILSQSFSAPSVVHYLRIAQSREDFFNHGEPRRTTENHG